MNILVRTGILFFAASLAGSLNAQTLADIGSGAPTPGPNDIYQFSTQGNTAWPKVRVLGNPARSASAHFSSDGTLEIFPPLFPPTAPPRAMPLEP